MKLCNDTITVFNSRLDDENGYNIYTPTVIRGVSWYSHVKSTITDTGLKAANEYIIRIPIDADFSGKDYVDSGAYALSDPGKTFTLRHGDHMVLGEESLPLTPAQALAKYGEIATITGVTDNRRAPRAKHWKVVGV